MRSSSLPPRSNRPRSDVLKQQPECFPEDDWDARNIMVRSEQHTTHPRECYRDVLRDDLEEIPCHSYDDDQSDEYDKDPLNSENIMYSAAYPSENMYRGNPCTSLENIEDVEQMVSTLILNKFDCKVSHSLLNLSFLLSSFDLKADLFFSASVGASAVRFHCNLEVF